jgi:hypothetical protein
MHLLSSRFKTRFIFLTPILWNHYKMLIIYMDPSLKASMFCSQGKIRLGPLCDLPLVYSKEWPIFQNCESPNWFHSMILLRDSTILSCLITGSRSFSRNMFSSKNNIRITNWTFSINTAKMSFHNRCFDHSSRAYFKWKKVHNAIVWKRICRISSAQSSVCPSS